MSMLRPSELEEWARSRPNSQAAFDRARKVMPQGIAQEMRLLRPFPLSIARGKGARKWDADGHEYIDYHLGSAALILGHAHPEVAARIREQIDGGWHYALGHPLEAEWGELVQQLIPSAERVRFVNSGTEATLLAMRLARSYTGKPKVLRFEGNYHGWHDFAIKGISPPFERTQSSGIPESVLGTIVMIPANDADLVAKVLDEDPEIGQVILEPSGGSWSTIPLRTGFLRALREITQARGRLLIFDEVISGFRWSPGGAQVASGVTPDITTMSKIASGGLPGGVVGATEEIMGVFEFTGDAEADRARRPYHGGTFNANPLTAAAAITTLRIVSSGEVQQHCDKLAAQLRDGFNAVLKRLDVSGVAYGESSTFHVYIGPRPAGTPIGETLWMEDAATLKGLPREMVTAIRLALHNRGVDFMSGLGGVLSSAHTAGDIEQTVAAFEGALKAVRDERPELLPA